MQVRVQLSNSAAATSSFPSTCTDCVRRLRRRIDNISGMLGDSGSGVARESGPDFL